MLKRTPLYETHRSLGARFTEFGGWDMPVQYTGILAEHRAVRTQAGLFDLSHMGEIKVRGTNALEVCQELLVTDVSRIQPGQAQYSVLCNPDGGIVDDVIVYRLVESSSSGHAEDHYFVCVNAAHIEEDYDWCCAHNRGRAEIINCSDATALIAIQGPFAADILQRLTALDLSTIRRYWSSPSKIAGAAGLIARTGYTGEDGFELFVSADQARTVWDACLQAGQMEGLVAVGLGARDTLRLEAGYLLYGQDMDMQTTPLEAGLSRLVHFEAGEFLGRTALQQQKSRGVDRKLIGVQMEERGIPRPGYPLWSHGQVVGQMTSGTQSPSLGIGIGLGYGPPTATPGMEITVEIRNRQVRARVVRPPFYSKEREKSRR